MNLNFFQISSQSGIYSDVSSFKTNDESSSSTSESLKSSKNDYYSMMEFAMLNFKSGLKYIEK